MFAQEIRAEFSCDVAGFHCATLPPKLNCYNGLQTAGGKTVGSVTLRDHVRDGLLADEGQKLASKAFGLGLEPAFVPEDIGKFVDLPGGHGQVQEHDGLLFGSMLGIHQGDWQEAAQSLTMLDSKILGRQAP